MGLSESLTVTPLERQRKHYSIIYSKNAGEQQEGESIDQYVAELRIVLGIKDCGARKRLLQQQQLTLQCCIDICKPSKA